MDWYEKLSEYFPAHEMKHPGQMEELLAYHPAYKKHETQEYVATYAEFPTFIFIDYLLVNPNIRGKGLGSKALSLFKSKDKTIILEVEPADTDKQETTQRIRFYERNGFQKAEHIVYTRSDEEGDPYEMDVYYWSPSAVSEREILHQMATICRDIHNFKSEKYYGRIVANPDDVLDWEH
jgi:ribosomal protein S18 acetylase RimI-like enzyme